MTQTDSQIYSYYVAAWNAAFGSGLTRQNIEIQYPIVQNYLQPKRLYSDGSTNPPEYVKSWILQSSHKEPEPETNAHYPPATFDFYSTIRSNPDFIPGHYYPIYKSHQIHYELPVSDYDRPLVPPKKIVYFPREIRRGMF